MKSEASVPSIFEAIATQRAVRRLRPDPVPASLIESIVFFATRAPSGANRQPWEFVVVTDPDRRSSLGDIYRHCSKELFQGRLAAAPDDATKDVYRDALYLSDHMAEAPVLIVVCARVGVGQSLDRLLPSVYPAIQNLLLAARGHGLGSVLTDAHKRAEEEVAALLDLPAGLETVCIVPVGYPAVPQKAFRPITSRRPVAEVIHWNRFGKSLSAT